MATERPVDAAEQELKKLEFRIIELIRTCERLKHENRHLREQYQGLAAERDRLLERSDRIKGRVTEILGRLGAADS